MIGIIKKREKKNLHRIVQGRGDRPKQQDPLALKLASI